MVTTPPTPDALPAFSALLLAGGRSRRMGRDKAALPWQGRTLLEHMSRLLVAAGAARVWRSGPYAGANGLGACRAYGIESDLQPIFHKSDRLLADIEPELGPVGGLLSLAGKAPDGLYLVVPVDMPLLDGALLHRLLEALVDADRTVGSVCFDGHVLPLALRLDDVSRTAIRAVAARPASGRSLRAVQQALNGIALALPDGFEAALSNCNTPEQWCELAQVGEGSR